MSSSPELIIKRYIAACSEADREALLEVLAPEAIHYFAPQEMKPVSGAEQIAKLWIDAQVVKPKWTIDNIVVQGDQVVIEYTNAFLSDPQDLSSKILNRGCEWYRLDAGKIVEIRAYFESDYSRDTGLTEYPYEVMGYTTRRADS